jgi:hypothetical protein
MEPTARGTGPRPIGALPPGAGKERATLVLRLDPAGRGATAPAVEPDPEFARLVRRTFTEAGFRMSDRWWAEVPLDDAAALRPLVERLEALDRSGRARAASGHLGVWLEDDEDAPLEWFELSPSRTFPLRRSAPYKEVSAGELPPGSHVARAGDHYVSETFRRAVEEEGLTGLELLWVRDVGRYRAPQWYEALPAQAIGRGLDHPWFDRAAFEAWWRTGGDTLPIIDSLLGSSGGAERQVLATKRDALLRQREHGAAERTGRFGARQFDTRFFRPGAGVADPARERLIRLFAFQDALNSLKVVSPLIVLRRFLPPTDFAFSWGEWEGGARDDDDVRFGGVCFNRRVRDILLARRLVQPEECRGVLVLDEPPPGALVFDDPARPVPPLLAPAQLAQSRAAEARHLARFQGRPRKERTVTLATALKRLGAARRAHTATFGKPAGAETLASAEAQLERPLPAAWRAVLGVSDGFEAAWEEEYCRVVGAAELVSFHPETLRGVEYTEGRPLSHLIFVGHWPDGDLLALEVPPGPVPEGCAVLRVDHEDGAEARRWPGVAEFLDELLG